MLTKVQTLQAQQLLASRTCCTVSLAISIILVTHQWTTAKLKPSKAGKIQVARSPIVLKHEVQRSSLWGVLVPSISGIVDSGTRSA